MRRTFGVLLICFLAMVLIDTEPVQATSYNLLVSASGDTGSVGNSGVRAEIRTRSYVISSSDMGHLFFVGNNLANGGFIQFGYELQTAGRYCLYGEQVGIPPHDNCKGASDSIANGDARWFWQYWPNAYFPDAYHGTGAVNSAGSDGSWHTYQIMPNSAGGWSFVFDGNPVANVNTFQWTKSRGSVFVAAEEVTDNTYASGSLGPVEFRNLMYYNQNWNQVSSLTALTSCSVLTPNCGISIPYGFTVLGPNHIVLGAGQPLKKDGELLWRGYQLSVTTPVRVEVVVDGNSYTASQLTVTLSPGLHSLFLPSMIQMDNARRMRFQYWSDGVSSSNRTMDLHSDTSLSASYVYQFKLTLTSPWPSSGEGWYDEGTTATFSTTSIPFMPITLQWYDETGNLLAHSSTGTISMDTPHVLQAKWNPDYVFLVIDMLIVILAIKIWRDKMSSQPVRDL